ncbi:XRE family transcriptional regulator [Neobacillus notoginsengisoli]|uniref:XRE family transcriptional regulator n=1 Tax=Neobacillus notoginsengisoli TaxID=1578198 RepID=A0A417YID5_9BACI|nr:helix-turn-helix transcriptional regulator [Neobacillus notoginsengisoli]RHW32809.1 XRE family transcriptional regulator [Neobacillus notoginsengisoli]
MGPKVDVKIKELLDSRKISLRELSRLADIRHAVLSEHANGKRKSISFHHIEQIAEALQITDIREIIDFKED